MIRTTTTCENSIIKQPRENVQENDRKKRGKHLQRKQIQKYRMVYTKLCCKILQLRLSHAYLDKRKNLMSLLNEREVLETRGRSIGKSSEL